VAKLFSPGLTTVAATLLALTLVAVTIHLTKPDYAGVRVGRVDAG